MKTRRNNLGFSPALAVLLFALTSVALAGDLNVQGNMNVASNLTASVITLQGAKELRAYPETSARW